MKAAKLQVAGAAVLLLIAAHASAQSVSSVKVGTAAPITPANADSAFYDDPGDDDVSTTSSWYSRPNEIIELARALEHDPDKIFDFVRNNIDSVWMYGLQKGALGALIDR
ncbi:MAG: hypothetical protein ACRDRT_18465, partial [Pseudonocardiaceae bacterium]